MSPFISRVFKYGIRHTDSELNKNTAIKTALATHFLKRFQYFLFLPVCLPPYLSTRREQPFFFLFQRFSLWIIVFNLIHYNLLLVFLGPSNSLNSFNLFLSLQRLLLLPYHILPLPFIRSFRHAFLLPLCDPQYRVDSIMILAFHLLSNNDWMCLLLS